MNYEINVALNGRHFFATADRSIGDMHKLKVVYREIIKRFPEADGFTVSVWRRMNTGELLAPEQLASFLKP